MKTLNSCSGDWLPADSHINYALNVFAFQYDENGTVCIFYKPTEANGILMHQS